MDALGFATKEEATLTTLTLDVIKSSEIEGEKLDYEQEQQGGRSTNYELVDF